MKTCDLSLKEINMKIENNIEAILKAIKTVASNVNFETIEKLIR